MATYLYIQQLFPENIEDYIQYLLSIGQLDDVAVQLAEIVSKVSFVVGGVGEWSFVFRNHLCLKKKSQNFSFGASYANLFVKIPTR